MANQIQFSAISDIGSGRENNEDNLYVDSQYIQQGEKGNFRLSNMVNVFLFSRLINIANKLA